MSITRDVAISIIEHAINESTFYPTAQAEAALNSLLPLVAECIQEHGVTEGMAILAGDDPRHHAAQLAIRGLGGDD